MTADDEAREVRERDHWDHHVASLEQCLGEYRAGPGPLDSVMLDLATAGAPERIIDFASGAGVTSAWLAARGFDVVGVELSPVSVRRAEELCGELGLDVEFRLIEPGRSIVQPGEAFDAMIGRFALHHLDLEEYAPILAEAVAPGGVAVFAETMALNPLLNVARKRLTGRGGIPKHGTADEHPLTDHDVAVMAAAFGKAERIAPLLYFFGLGDAYLFRHRSPLATRVLQSLDRGVGRALPRARDYSYHQLVACERATAD